MLTKVLIEANEGIEEKIKSIYNHMQDEGLEIEQLTEEVIKNIAGVMDKKVGGTLRSDICELLTSK